MRAIYKGTVSVEWLIQYLESKYQGLLQHNHILISGNRRISLTTLYQALLLLRSNHYSILERPYPAKGQYAQTGWVNDWFSSQTALMKVKVVISNAVRSYQAIIREEFPLLYDELDAYYGTDFIYILLEYSNDKPQLSSLQTYYLKAIDPIPNAGRPLLIELSQASSILRENNMSSLRHNGIIKETIYHKGRPYKIVRTGGFSLHDVLFKKYNCLVVLYKLFEIHFKEYFDLKLGEK